jgi:small subunit ribosomal protein S16
VLKIRLTRTGKTSQESFRIVVAEHRKAVKKEYLELLGHYSASKKDKPIEVKKERIEHWIKMGAQPTDTVASLLKRNGFANMDKFITVKNRQRKDKNAAAA